MSARARYPVWLPVSLLWIGPATFAIINTVAQRILAGMPTPTIRELIWEGGDWFLYAFITPIIYTLVGRWPVVRPHLPRRVLLHFGFALMFCVLWAVGGKVLQAGLAAYFEPGVVRETLASSDPATVGRLARNVASWIFITLPFGIVVYGSMAGLFHAIRYFELVRQREAQLSEARLAALQARLNPHFLFNTLNTIVVKARDGEREGTVRIVEQLSEVLRRTLSRHQRAEVTLDEELELVRLYLGIEQARFSDRLAPVFELDHAALGVLVPSFAIQHLVENAVRHGIARRRGAGLVAVSATRVGDTAVVTVRDDGPGPPTGDAFPAGHGLENTRERLRVLHGDHASLTILPAQGGGTVATMTVPWRVPTREAQGA